MHLPGNSCKATLFLITAGLVVAGGLATAEPQAPPASAGADSPATVPQSAFFAGAGANYSSTLLTRQNVYAQGVSDIFFNGMLVGSGSAGGPAEPLFDAVSQLAPTVHAGYFRHFSAGTRLWGVKFSYSHQRATAIEKNFVIPQVGSFTSSVPGTFTGNVVVRSYRSSVEHQMTWMPFVGPSFGNGFVYFGAGPSLSRLTFDLDGMIGFAALNGKHENITGTPSNFSGRPWVFGGAAVIGATHFFNRSWFVDFSYTYALTRAHTGTFSAPFATSTDGYDDTGVISGTYSGGANTQALSVSISRAW